MPTVDSNFFEIQRRGYQWSPLSTLDDGVTSLGYDANPNDASSSGTPGEQKLVSMPIGAFYIQSNGTLWLKSAMPNVWVGIIAASTTTTSITTGCASNVAVNDAVYIYTSDTVRKANASAIATCKVIGIVISKLTTTTCIVVLNGEVSGFSGLTANKSYFLDNTTAGLMTLSPPSVSGAVVTTVGIALNDNTLLVNPTGVYTIRG